MLSTVAKMSFDGFGQLSTGINGLFMAQALDLKGEKINTKNPKKSIDFRARKFSLLSISSPRRV